MKVKDAERLKRDTELAMGQAVLDFQSQTGLTVKDVQYRTIDLTTLDSDRPESPPLVRLIVSL